MKLWGLASRRLYCQYTKNWKYANLEGSANPFQSPTSPPFHYERITNLQNWVPAHLQTKETLPTSKLIGENIC